MNASVLIIEIVFIAILLVTWWIIFKKADKPSWQAIVPILNVYVIIQIAGKPKWWFLLLFVPIVNLVVAILVLDGLSENFGKGTVFTFGLIFLTPICLMILAFGDASYAMVKHQRGFYTFPWSFIFLISLGIILSISIATDAIYSGIFDQLKEGISTTLYVSLSSYFLALMIAIFVGIVRSNPPEPPQTKDTTIRAIKRIVQTILYNVCTVYVSVMRGLPVLIVLLVTAFIIVPALRDLINSTVVVGLRTATNNPDFADLIWRGSSAPSAIVALAVTYGAYMSETIRAGIQSIHKGQVEAAYSVGMSYFQTMRYIVLPQAFRNVLPPLGNDFVAMIKDSSLLAFLGVRDVTQVAKTSAGRSFRYVETYAIVAFIYLNMVIIASTIVNLMEATINVEQETPKFIQQLSQLGKRQKRKPKSESFD